MNTEDGDLLDQLFLHLRWCEEDKISIDKKYLKSRPWVALELADRHKDWATFRHLMIRFKECTYKKRALLLHHLDMTKEMFDYNYIKLSVAMQERIFGFV